MSTMPEKQTVPNASVTAPAGAPLHTPVVLGRKADEPHGFAEKAARWIHQHPDTPKTEAGYLGYQLVRGVASAIPYGTMMALTLGGLAGVERWGAAVQKTAKSPMVQKVAARAEQLVKFPAFKSSMMIATSFTLYRGTGKLVKWANDSLFNPKDTEAQTAEKIRHLPRDTWNKMKDQAPAGLASTPVAAFVLGFVNANFTKSPSITTAKANGISYDWTRANYLKAKEKGLEKQLLKDVITHPSAKFVEQAAINTLGYSLFFEMGDRLFKDRQVARGKWAGDAHSIKALKGDATPDMPEQKKHYGFFTDEPSVGRFVFRRMLPTAVSISAYTAFKFRHAYMQLGDFALKPAEKVMVEGVEKNVLPKILPQIPNLIKVETIAVLWFTMIPYISEKWEKAYDNFFAKKEKQAAAKDIHSYQVIDKRLTTRDEAPKVEELPQPSAKVAQVVNHGKATPQALQVGA